jgi:asparagine synthase (glutamine-hydrolysing)
MGAFVASLAIEAGQAPPVISRTGFLPPSADGYESWSSGGFSFVRSRFWACPENAASQVPKQDGLEEHGLICVADARLDHRDDLIRMLPPTREATGASDAELILRAYHAWGDECPDRLRGDFAFVIWDGQHRKLFGAGDPFGVRSLRYHMGRDALWLGTRSRAVAQCLSPSVSLNLPLLRAYVRSDFSKWSSETAYASVARLPPGYSLTFRDGRLTLARYCRIGDAPAAVFQRDEDYVARYRALQR